jgi:hypothetical protein
VRYLRYAPRRFTLSLRSMANSSNNYWRDHVGFGIDLLTEAEAGYVLRAPTVDAIRTGMAQARGG